MRLRWIGSLLFAFLILPSCSGTEDDATPVPENKGDETEQTSGVIEHELDEGRLDAVGYNNKLNDILAATLDDMDLLFASDSSNIEQNLENILFNLDLNHTAVVETPEFETEEQFRQNLLELLAYYISELNGTFSSDVRPLLLKTERSDTDLDFLESYDLEFSTKEKVFFDAVMTAQENFAKKHNIRLTE